MSEAQPQTLGDLAGMMQKMSIALTKIHEHNEAQAKHNEEQTKRMTKLEQQFTDQQQQLAAQRQELRDIKTNPQLALGDHGLGGLTGLDNPAAHLLSITEGEGETKDLARRVLTEEALDTPMTKRDFKLLLEQCIGPVIQKELVIANRRINFTDMKLRMVQEEQKRMLMRVAWMEKDMLALQ